MKIAVTGATGHYGSALIASLLAKGAEPGDVLALVRDTAKADELARKGVEVRQFDYTNVDSGALDGVDRLFFIPSADLAGRVPQNEAVIRAAQQAGVGHLFYLSFIGAQEFPNNPLTLDHKATEDVLAESSLTWTAVRSGYYFENFLAGAEGYVASGVVPSASQDGKIAGAARAEMAEAAASMLLSDVPPTGMVTFAGRGLTTAEMTKALADAAGASISVRQLTPPELKAALQGFGMPEFVAGVFSAVDESAVGGSLDSDSTALAEYLGREPKSFADAAREWAASQR